jgi:hypothetical protein
LRLGLCAQPGKTSGCNLFAGLPFRFYTLMQKVAMPLSGAFGHPFFPVLSEAYLLTGKKWEIK